MRLLQVAQRALRFWERIIFLDHLQNHIIGGDEVSGVGLHARFFAAVVPFFVLRALLGLARIHDGLREQCRILPVGFDALGGIAQHFETVFADDGLAFGFHLTRDERHIGVGFRVVGIDAQHL